MKNFKMKKSITQKYPAKAESILSSCFVIKPATNNKLEYCEAKDVLWDTGATNTIISRNIADALGLEPIQKAMIAGIGGNVEAYTYKISLYFAKEGAWIKDLEVLACDLEDNDIIIGMDTKLSPTKMEKHGSLSVFLHKSILNLSKTLII